jgi:hypothetical protein
VPAESVLTDASRMSLMVASTGTASHPAERRKTRPPGRPRPTLKARDSARAALPSDRGSVEYLLTWERCTSLRLWNV